jgi:hypothetical protein
VFGLAASSAQIKRKQKVFTVVGVENFWVIIFALLIWVVMFCLLLSCRLNLVERRVIVLVFGSLLFVALVFTFILVL